MRARLNVAIIGAGVIGAGWVARFVLHGAQVQVFDPAVRPEQVQTTVRTARAHLEELYDHPLPQPGTLTFVDSIAAAVEGADWVQESSPEQLDRKRTLLQEIERSVGLGAVVASSTSGFTPTALQEGLMRPERVIVCHPFNPVYLLPLVEVVASAANGQDVVERARTTLASIAMKPLVLKREIDAHIADRLLEAMWREALWLVNDGVATTEQVDDAIRFGFGLRFAQMGLFETYRLGGGEGGMRHFLAQFGPALEWPWTHLTDVPDLDDALIERIAQQSDAQTGERTVDEMVAERDRNLVAILRALKHVDSAAGAHLRRWESGR